MKERPILFQSEMVRAILDGRKTQTRRIVKPQPINRAICATNSMWYDADCINPGRLIKPKYGQPGDRLWVRETWRIDAVEPPPGQFTKRLRVRYRADNAKVWFEQGKWPSGSILDPQHWTPSIFMPRWASRITLEIVSVRVERVQEISAKDCEAEGLEHVHRGWWVNPNAKDPIASGDTEGCYCYRKLWDSINSKTHPWENNPWVWVIAFKRM